MRDFTDIALYAVRERIAVSKLEGIRSRKALAEKAEQAKNSHEYQVLNEQLQQFTDFFTETTQAALERLERNGFPHGRIEKLPNEIDELVLWTLPIEDEKFKRDFLYNLASDGTIRVAPSDDSDWDIISPKSVRREASIGLVLTKDLNKTAAYISRVRSIVEQCNTICPDEPGKDDAFTIIMRRMCAQ